LNPGHLRWKHQDVPIELQRFWQAIISDLEPVSTFAISNSITGTFLELGSIK